MLLGPQCNHDVGVLLRLCDIPANATGGLPDVEHTRTVKAAMVEAMADHEYYVSSYSSKSQPHADGLKLTLAASLERKKRASDAAKNNAIDGNEHESARKTLHTLVAATNNRMHKGFPQMLSYLMGKPICYSSHNFVPIMTTNLMRMLQKHGDTLAKGMEHSAPAPVRRYYNIKIPAKPFLTEFDYLHRPSELEDFPLYFFFAGCEARPARGGRRPNDALDWYMLGNHRQYTARPVESQAYPGVPLRHPPSSDDPLGAILYVYSYYVKVRLDQAWRVPLLQGWLPHPPQSECMLLDDGTIDTDAVRYAIYMQLLFRPFRSVDAFFRNTDCKPWIHGATEFWKSFLAEFQHWRAQLALVAQEHRSHAEPLSVEWLACRTCDAMKHYDLAASRHQVVAEKSPDESVLCDLPFAVPVDQDANSQALLLLIPA